jgi:hypothetical protein
MTRVRVWPGFPVRRSDVTPVANDGGPTNAQILAAINDLVTTVKSRDGRIEPLEEAVGQLRSWSGSRQTGRAQARALQGEQVADDYCEHHHEDKQLEVGDQDGRPVRCVVPDQAVREAGGYAGYEDPQRLPRALRQLGREGLRAWAVTRRTDLGREVTQ